MLRHSLQRLAALGFSATACQPGFSAHACQPIAGASISPLAARHHLQSLRWLSTGAPAAAAAASAEQAVERKASPGGHGGGGKPSLAGLVLLVPAGIAAFLGSWQLERRRWKQDLLGKRESSLKGEAIDVFSLPQGEAPPEFSRVAAQGVLQHPRAQYVGPRPRSVVGGTQAGYVVITPLIDPATQRTVLVNRGWVPAEWRADADARRATEPLGVVTVEGVAMRSEKPGGFVPENEPQGGQWYWIDAPALAEACGAPSDAPLVEVVAGQDAPNVAKGTVPNAMDVLAGRKGIGKVAEEFPLTKHVDTFVRFPVMPSDHLNYAATWFSLAAATSFMAMRAMRGARGRPRSRHGAT